MGESLGRGAQLVEEYSQPISDGSSWERAWVMEISIGHDEKGCIYKFTPWRDWSTLLVRNC